MSVSVSDRELEGTPVVDEKMERRKSDAAKYIETVDVVH
jgi:hypothetical protein